MQKKVHLDKGFKQFLILWSGQFMSLLGGGLASFGFPVWLHEKTGSATPLAISLLVTILPGILFGPLAGSFADRRKRKVTIMMANGLDIAIKALLAALYYLNALDLWVIYLLLFCSATFQTFQGPSLSASIPALVPAKNLSRANGLMQFSQKTQSMLSPALAGFLYPLVGLPGLLGANFITFIFAMLIFALLKIPQPTLEKSNKPILGVVVSDFKVSLNYLLNKAGLLKLILALGIINAVSQLTTPLMGALVLGHYNAKIYGSVQSFLGLAVLLGGLLAGVLPNVDRKVKTMFMVSMLTAFGITFAGMSLNWQVIAIGFFFYNLTLPYISSLLMSILQTKVEPKFLGRVTALTSMILRMIMPFAILLAGPLADKVFEPAMNADGILGRSFLGTLLGTGLGKGISLIFILAGLGIFLLNTLALRNKNLITLEERLPNFDRLQKAA